MGSIGDQQGKGYWGGGGQLSERGCNGEKGKFYARDHQDQDKAANMAMPSVQTSGAAAFEMLVAVLVAGPPRAELQKIQKRATKMTREPELFDFEEGNKSGTWLKVYRFMHGLEDRGSSGSQFSLLAKRPC